jgi:hypothetical protein
VRQILSIEVSLLVGGPKITIMTESGGVTGTSTETVEAVKFVVFKVVATGTVDWK